MKLVFAIKSLAVPGGGAERVFVEVVNGLFCRGHDVEVMTFDRDPSSFYELDPRIRRTDLKLLSAWGSFGPLKLIRSIFRIRAFVRSTSPDLVVGFMHSAYVPIGLALMGTSVGLVSSEHADAVHFEKRPIQQRLKKLVDRKSLVRTVPSETVARNFRALLGVVPMVVPNPIKVSEPMDRVEGTCRSHGHIILTVGRLMEEKDQSTLVQAFATVCEDFPEWRLRIVGDGPLRGILERRVAALGLSTVVEFAGISKNVESEYVGASLVVLPSRYESFGMVAAEALASSRAVLSFKECAGIAEIVQSGRNGLLVTGGGSRQSRIKALAAGLRILMSDPDGCRKLGAAGPDSVQKFSPEHVIDAWEEVLILAERKMERLNASNEIGVSK